MFSAARPRRRKRACLNWLARLKQLGRKQIKERRTHMKASRIAMYGSTGLGRRQKADQSILKSLFYVTIVIACAALLCAPLQASTASSTSFNRPLVFEPNQG